jgi:hypothetical protein
VRTVELRLVADSTPGSAACHEAVTATALPLLPDHLFNNVRNPAARLGSRP